MERQEGVSVNPQRHSSWPSTKRGQCVEGKGGSLPNHGSPTPSVAVPKARARQMKSLQEGEKKTVLGVCDLSVAFHTRLALPCPLAPCPRPASPPASRRLPALWHKQSVPEKQTQQQPTQTPS